MKNLLLALLLIISTAPAFAQKNQPEIRLDAISNYFSEYVDDPDFTAVYVSGKIFELFKDTNLQLDEIDDEETKAILEVVKDIKGIRILHTELNSKRLYADAKRRIPTNDYELLFKVRTKDNDLVEAFVQDQDAVVSELFMLVGSDSTFAMLSFVGAIDLSKVAALQKALDE